MIMFFSCMFSVERHTRARKTHESHSVVSQLVCPIFQAVFTARANSTRFWEDSQDFVLLWCNYLVAILCRLLHSIFMDLFWTKEVKKAYMQKPLYAFRLQTAV